MAYELNVSPRVKVLLFIGVAFLIVYNVPYKIWFWGMNTKQFFSGSFTSTVIDSSVEQGRFWDFELQNGIHVYLPKSSSGIIKLGDQIKKGKNTYDYTIYRANSNGSYEFISTGKYPRP